MSWTGDKGDLPASALELAMMLQNMLVGFATGSALDEPLYLHLRKEFMGDPTTRDLLPSYVLTNRNGGALWGYFKIVSPQYKPRREHIWKTFGPLLNYLEGRSHAPSDLAITDTLASFDPDAVHQAWQKALERRENDPEGAITAARTLLETVCKHILEEAKQEYGQNDDLPQLYGKAARVLTIAPSQHTEEAFRSILGSCQNIVNGLGTLRNKIGDAHGKGKLQIKPSPRHAALAVNLAGSMATFLVETWRLRSEVESGTSVGR